MKIVILDGQVANPGDLDWSALASQATEGEFHVYPRTAPGEVVERCRGAEAVFTNKVVLDAATLAELPSLRFVGVLATGYNNVDTDAARRRGITVCNVPAYSTDSVAQLVMAMLLELTNHVAAYSASVGRGDWQHCEDFSYTLWPITELSGKTMGIYGMGNIGSRVARIALALGMHVVSPTRKPADSIPAGVEKTSFDDMLRRSDVVSVHCPLSDTTRGQFGAEAFARMKPTAIFINTSRGPVVDEAALAAALREGRLGAAAVDVLEHEPPRESSPLIGAPRCIVTPHIAWQSVEARRRLLQVSADNLAAFLAGKPVNVVN